MVRGTHIHGCETYAMVSLRASGGSPVLFNGGWWVARRCRARSCIGRALALTSQKRVKTMQKGIINAEACARAATGELQWLRNRPRYGMIAAHGCVLDSRAGGSSRLSQDATRRQSIGAIWLVKSFYVFLRYNTVSVYCFNSIEQL